MIHTTWILKILIPIDMRPCDRISLESRQRLGVYRQNVTGFIGEKGNFTTNVFARGEQSYKCVSIIKRS